MTRCLITGATGFVGENLVRHVQSLGWQPTALVRETSQTERMQELQVPCVCGSLETGSGLAEAVANADVVFHAAGKTTALDFKEFSQTNVTGTEQIAQACAAAVQPPTLVLVSSLAAGGPATLEQPRAETDVNEPVSEYGRSKLAGEQAAAKVAAQVPLSIVRPPIIFGPGDHAGLSLYHSIRTMRIHPRPAFREFPVSLIHVEDLCQALVRVAEAGERVPSTAQPRNESRDQGEGIYYVAAERDVPYAELGKLAAAAAGWSALVLPLPPAMFWVVGAIGEVWGRVRRRPALMNFDKVREALSQGWVCDATKISADLGFAPRQTLEDRFQQTVAWYREAGWL